ncbi:MAG TPA: tetratricopeptide repeat protein [Casimicrobiaceae bacterium]|jgi:TPR repeat protein|nr:tetratricopeptide repeat protein [Casimicrobiaceae bacterium]
MKIQRILFALLLLVAYPAIADTAARAETLPGATMESLRSQLYRAANEANDPDVMYLAGLMFDRGEGVPQDYKEAFRWYALAAGAGHADAMNSLGLMYALGHGVSQDLSEAMKWWSKAADGGSVAALSNIATTYYTGLGVGQSYPDAAKWFQLAANKGDANAMNTLGVMYAQGLGVARNRGNAIKLFGQSAYLGCSTAMINLGALYAAGKGVKQDNALAYAWLISALALGVSADEHDATVYTLGMTAARLGPNQLSRAQGLARKIAATIINRQAVTPDHKSDQARLGSMI